MPRIKFNTYYNEHIYEELRLCDTGSSYFTIPATDKWDYENGDRYLDVSDKRGRYGYYYSQLNNNIEKVEEMSLETEMDSNTYKKVLVFN